MIIRSDHTTQVMHVALERRTAAAEGPAVPSSLRAVSPSWLAHRWNVHVRTIYRDIGKGALKAFRLPGGQIRILRDDAERYGRPVD